MNHQLILHHALSYQLFFFTPILFNVSFECCCCIGAQVKAHFLSSPARPFSLWKHFSFETGRRTCRKRAVTAMSLLKELAEWKVSSLLLFERQRFHHGGIFCCDLHAVSIVGLLLSAVVLHKCVSTSNEKDVYEPTMDAIQRLCFLLVKAQFVCNACGVWSVECGCGHQRETDRERFRPKVIIRLCIALFGSESHKVHYVSTNCQLTSDGTILEYSFPINKDQQDCQWLLAQ